MARQYLHLITLIKFFTYISFLTLFISCSKNEGFAPSILDNQLGLSISPNSPTLAIGNSITFTTTGGDGLYTYSIESGSGSILSTTGVFTAPSAAGVTIIKVIDGAGKYAETTVTIVPELTLNPNNLSLGVNGTQTFTPSGGVPPYSFSKVSGVGTINQTTGFYTASSSAGVAVVQVTDALGNSAQANISVFSALGISPNNGFVTVNSVQLFTAAGGTAPYTFSILSGLGNINSSNGNFTAANIAGDVVVRVTDAAGAHADAFITVINQLQISPVSQTVLTGSSIVFSASGGLEPYSFSIAVGTGTINHDLGSYVAPMTTGFATVRVTDALGQTSDSVLTITSILTLSPTSTTMAVNNTANFMGQGGLPPYSYSIVSGGGTINSTTGVYTAGSSAGSAIVRVTDSLGSSVNSTVTINSALSIAPANPTTTALTGQINFTASGGVLPYSYSIFSGTGSVHSSSGVFTAPSAAGSSTIRVTDAYGNTAQTNVTIIDGLGINPAGVTLSANSIFTFTGLSGQSPYTYSIVSGGGTINSSTGQYTAPSIAGLAVVRITDSLNNTADANVTINPVLQISPASLSLAVNNSYLFTANGGVSPYSYSIVSGGGSINVSTGQMTAPSVAGSVIVRVTDINGATSESNLTINSALSILPVNSTITVSDTRTLTASGGVPPYVFDLVSGSGAIDSVSGVYTPTTAGTVTVRLTDSLNNSVTTQIQVNQALQINPAVTNLTINTELNLTTSGGVSPFTYSIVSGGGSIDSATGVFTAPSSSQTTVVRVTDSMGHISNATLTMYIPLTLNPLIVTMGVNQTQSFVGSGGVAPLSYSVYDGDGDIDVSTGLYTSPSTSGVELIRVTDSIGNVVQAEVTVVSELTIVPQQLKLPVFSTAVFTSILGTSPYNYSILSGGGFIDSGTGVLSADSVVGLATVQVEDAALDTDESSVSYIKPVQIVSGNYHNCVRYHEGSVKCFGDAATGKLGSGSTADLGDAATEIGGAIPFVDLGQGRTALFLAAGIAHTCALLDNQQIKCWGHNTYGQLGVGSTNHRGDGPSELGDNLPTVNLGVGRTAQKIFAFGYVTCALLDNNSTKCWGRNNYGQLGQGNITNRGTAVSQMGDNMPAIDFGTGRSAVHMTGGLDFTCALLDNASVKCFGRNNYGQLGIENVNTIGDGAGEMGDALLAVNLGSGRSVIKLGAGYDHVCALLDNNSTKCWGRNNRGQLGQGNTTTRGDGVGEMGDALAVTALTSFTPESFINGFGTSCAINSSGQVRCWGYNNRGQLLIGNVANQGDGASEIAALTDMNFGSALSVSSFSFGYYHGCAILSNDRIKCFGYSLNGALLNGSTTLNLGDAAGENGDSLPFVNH